MDMDIPLAEIYMDIPLADWRTPEYHPFKALPESNWILPNYEWKSGTFYFIQHEDMLVPCSTFLKPSETTLDQLHQTKCRVMRVNQNEIKDIEGAGEMVQNAKDEEWNEVESFLDEKKYLVNIIPVNEPWAVLHHAIVQNKDHQVNLLLNKYECDPKIRTSTEYKEVPAGTMPKAMAKMKKLSKRDEIIEMLDKSNYQPQSALTLLSEKLGSHYVEHGVPYFVLSMALIRKEVLERIKNLRDPKFDDIMQSVYEYMKNDYEKALDDVKHPVYLIDANLKTYLKNVHDFASLCKALLKIYTGPNPHGKSFYLKVNEALRRASHKDLNPSGDDWLLGVYSIFLEAVILHYDELETHTGLSYRGSHLNDGDLKEYKVGKKFYTLQFFSSSTDEEAGNKWVKNVKFVIDNSAECKTRPKLISDHSASPHEKEALYPSLTKFEVTGHQENVKLKVGEEEKEITEIKLKLISED